MNCSSFSHDTITGLYKESFSSSCRKSNVQHVEFPFRQKLKLEKFSNSSGDCSRWAELSITFNRKRSALVCMLREDLHTTQEGTHTRDFQSHLNDDDNSGNFESELKEVLARSLPESEVDLGNKICLPVTSGDSAETSTSDFKGLLTEKNSEQHLKELDRKIDLKFTEDLSAKNKSKYVRASWEALVRWSRSLRSINKDKDNVLVKTTKIAILGGGSFGTAMGVMLARNKEDLDVCMLMRNSEICESINKENKNRKAFPRHELPKNVRATTDPREALDGAQFCIHAVPVQASAQFLESIAEYMPPTMPILSVSKGLEVGTLEMMSQVIPRALRNPKQPVAVLSGPSFSIELMDELPTAIVAASKDKQLARAAQQLLASKYLRVNTSTDVVGVEMAGALKNVLAIAAGIVEGMNLGNNCMAALVAQGCSEIRWLAEKMGANPATLAGLAGTGDIMLTCFVNLSRNRSVGVRLGAGEKLDDILSSMSQVAEGIATASAVIALARKYRVQLPVLTAVARILENELTPKQAVMDLMTLPQIEEK